MAKKLPRRSVVIVILLLFIVGCSIVFVLQMEHMIESNMMNTIIELADHDMVSIENFIERNWHDLQGIFNRLVTYDCKTINDLQARMNLERSTGEFHMIYLIDEDGNVYTDRYMVYPKEQLNIAQYISDSDDQIAVRYDYEMATESKKEMVLYAIRLDDYTVDGVTFVGLAGISSITQIQDRLALYSFYKNDVNRGYSSVVNFNGDYIVNIRRTISLNQRENLFHILSKGQTPPEWSNEAVKAHMLDNESFSFYYVDSNGVDELLYFAPIDSVNWYLILMVERSVFTDLSKSLIFMGFVMVFITIVISLAAMMVMVKSQQSVFVANEKAKARSEFLSSMSHEIRTPLNGVLGSLHLIRAHIEDTDKTQVISWLDKADSTARYLLTLISDFLDMSKLQNGKLKLAMLPFSLDDMLCSVESIQQSNVENKGLTLTIEKELPFPYIIGDEIRLKQVFINIIGNAVKFTPSGGLIRLKASQESIDAHRIKTTISCTDTGIGMSPQFVNKIWDSFSQENNADSDGTRGTGLGMAISKSIINAMGGDITVSSAPGKGSEFRVVFCADIAEVTEGSSLNYHQGDALEAAAPIRSQKLLVAEDNQLNAEILIAILEDEGFEVLHAENGQAAVELFMQSSIGEIDAILMDMQMPVMDGCHAAQKIRSLPRSDAKTVSIFACTANAFQEDRDKALSSGMNDFLTKPIDVDALLGKILEHQIRKVETE